MKKYRYVEFTDGTFYSVSKRGHLYIVSDNPSAYIEEFSLIETSNKGGKFYYTTLENIGNLGWELAFVTPCGNMAEHGSQMIQNAYIFKKEIEE